MVFVPLGGEGARRGGGVNFVFKSGFPNCKSAAKFFGYGLKASKGCRFQDWQALLLLQFPVQGAKNSNSKK